MSDSVIETEDGASGASRGQDFIVPRISIETFCATPDFASAMQTASSDRRMARAKTSVGMGGIAAAVKRYSHTGMPNLIIVESIESGFAILAELEELAKVCEDDTRVMVAGPSNDVTLYRELIRQGVTEYLVTPSSPMQIIEAITNAFEDPAAAPAAKTISVFGVRGGAGSSTVAHNLAHLLSSRIAKDTVLVDLDIEFGSAALNFNIDAKHSIADALLDVSALDDTKMARLFHRETDTLRLLPSAASIAQARYAADEDSVLTVLDFVRQACECAVIDTPNRWVDATRCALRQADQIVLVAAPDLISLRNLKTLNDWVKAERPHDQPPRIILNQTGEPKRPEIGAREFEDIIGRPVSLLWPYDPALFGAAQNDGKMLADLAAGKRHVEGLMALLDNLLGKATRTKTQKSLSLSKLLRPFSG